jgi:hypothetical protein
MANCIVDSRVNCTLRWRPLENVLNIHHWTAHLGKALWYTNWKFLRDLHIWGKDKWPMRPNLWIHESSAHWRQRFIGHVQWKVWIYRHFTSLKVMGDWPSNLRLFTSQSSLQSIVFPWNMNREFFRRMWKFVLWNHQFVVHSCKDPWKTLSLAQNRALRES